MEIVTREMDMIASIYIYDLDNNVMDVMVMMEIVMMEIVTMEIVTMEMEIEIVIVTREMEMIMVIDNCNRMGNNVYKLDNEDVMMEMTIEIVMMLFCLLLLYSP
jgi:hypothetical protein